jgi:hypothetical protein
MKKTRQYISSKVNHSAEQWLTPVILVAQEAEIRKIVVHGHPRQTVCEILCQK